MINQTFITGFPRIGEYRELKFALEKYWAQNSSFDELASIAKLLRQKHWQAQQAQGITYISSNDFSYYDNMLDTAVMLNAIPPRFQRIRNPEERYFAMARGNKEAVAMAMCKWFNSNYHYIVPEIDDSTDFSLNASKILTHYREAKSIGINTKIHLIGPLTFLGLSQIPKGKSPCDYFEIVLAVYQDLLSELNTLDDDIIVQFDEPVFAKDPDDEQLALLQSAYDTLASTADRVRVLVMTYFEHATEAVEVLGRTPIWGIGLDFVHGEDNLACLENVGSKKLFAGVVDGRNIWVNNYEQTLNTLNRIAQRVPKSQIVVGSSCSLLHVPYTTANEPDSDIKPWLAFAIEKVAEVARISRLFHGSDNERDALALSERTQLIRAKQRSHIMHNAGVNERVNNIETFVRRGDFDTRITVQKSALNLPLLPTTTIGSFPQTAAVRKTRLDYKKGRIAQDEYTQAMQQYIDDCIVAQEEIGLDVLVHGEPERNDMVEYFGELLSGFHFTENAWVQSYGSRCVKPPVIYGDIQRPEAMTVRWITYAQSRTDKVVKGMLTGPVTMINWSFVRDDKTKAEIATQIALALADEIDDLQKAGIKIVQVDEAAFKEGYPLRQQNIAAYEKWALDSFKLTVSSAWLSTQIHTHMCYSEFNNIIKTIEAMDADVITIETSRGGNKLLSAFQQVGYANEIGPGVYDIHSPRTPTVEEFSQQIKRCLAVVDADKMWVNPDCGLKTRHWDEVRPALSNMVQATQTLR